MKKKISRAFISVSDKSYLVELAKSLIGNNVEIIASDGSAAVLNQAGIPVKSVEEVTGFTQILSGRVKTLHPSIYGAVLADLDQPEHLKDLAKLNIIPIDLVVINFYDVDKFDIGGPALVRAAVKNSKDVAVLTDPNQYQDFMDQLANGFDQSQRDLWAKAALLKVARYDQAILNSLGEPLRYGENPHQRAAVIGDELIAGAKILSGKQMSYNNYLDANCAWQVVNEHTQPTIAFIKHTTPCGVATAQSISIAFKSALASDPISAFGGVIATNQEVDSLLANLVVENFYELLIAPGFSKDALNILKTKENLRVVEVTNKSRPNLQIREILGGFLFQQSDQLDQSRDDFKGWELVSGKEVSKEAESDLTFAWQVVKSVRSNGIVIAKDLATIGIGMGQSNRLDSVTHALARAGDKANGAVLASDGFFPFADSINLLAQAGISAIVQPGGSIKDDEVIKACKDAGISMYLTGVRHFSH